MLLSFAVYSERERLEKIKRNEELMRELQVMSGSSTIGVPASATKKKPAAAKARPSKPIAPRVKREAPLPTRSSSRLKGHVADTETLKRKVEEEAEEARVRAQEAKRARHADHDLKSLTGGTLLEDELEVLRKSLMKASGRSNVPKSEGDEEHGAAPFSAETIALSKVVNGMQLRSVSKVTPARIYSMAYHPSVDRDLIFMGDKEGNLGVWDALAQQDGGEESEDDMPAGKAWSLQAHGKSPVTCLRFDPISSESLFSSSYDSTLRMFSLASSTSTEVWAGQDDVLLSIFDILAPQVHPTAFTSTPAHGLDERSIWIGDHRGGLVHVDLREGKAKRGGHRWQVSEKKVRRTFAPQAHYRNLTHALPNPDWRHVSQPSRTALHRDRFPRSARPTVRCAVLEERTRHCRCALQLQGSRRRQSYASPKRKPDRKSSIQKSVYKRGL